MKAKSLVLFIILIAFGNSIDAQSVDLAESIIAETNVFEEKNGIVAVEAEYFYKQSKTEKRQWYRINMDQAPKVVPDNDGNNSVGASNNGYVEILPDTRVTHDDKLIHGENFSNDPGVLGILHYRIKINNPGRYYIWARTFSSGSEDNGLHVGLNGTWPAHGQRMQWCDGKNEWTWDSKQRTKEVHCGVANEIYLDIDKGGIHDIQFSMREDGFEFDKFILVRDISYVPNDKGPRVSDYSIETNSSPENKVLPTINPPIGRIAIVADGNSPDPDDLGATAVSLALLRASGFEDRLVHYSHSCDLVQVERISDKAERERHALMQSACDVTARRWGGFESLTFYDAKWQQQETIDDLVMAINNSSAEDPLWIIEAGEPDIIGYALDTSQKSKHQYVKVITHHLANDNAGDFYSWQQILDFGIEEVRIPDQNVNLKVPIEKWDWAKDHQDARLQQVWLQGKIAEVDNVVKFQKGKWDCSDAGMVLYWLTGATNGGLSEGVVEDVKSLLLDYVTSNPE